MELLGFIAFLSLVVTWLALPNGRKQPSKSTMLLTKTSTTTH